MARHSSFTNIRRSLHSSFTNIRRSLHSRFANIKRSRVIPSVRLKSEDHARYSNNVIGILNLLTLLASIPLIGGGLWMARNSGTCESFLQKPLLIVGFVILVVSLAGFVGACFRVSWALWLYLVVMLLFIAALLTVTVFGFVVTSSRGGVPVPDRLYREYRLSDYSTWLQNRVRDPAKWQKIRDCIVRSSTCAKIVQWTPVDYLQQRMSPVQSGCCKPPISCNVVNGEITITEQADCMTWNQAHGTLCYECDACKAGVLEEIRLGWQKLSVLIIVILVFLVCIYFISYCAFQNSKRWETGYSNGEARMTKLHPRWDYICCRWFHEQRERLY